MTIESKDTWAASIDPTVQFRTWAGKVWMRETGPQFFAGYRIKTVPQGSRIAAEWLARVTVLS